jgi:hypothetical protein
MFYFGSWLMLNRGYSMRDYFISLFGLMLSLTGLAAAMSGLTDADKAKAAAMRIFELTERISEIDPLSEDGYKPGMDSPDAFMAKKTKTATNTSTVASGSPPKKSADPNEHTWCGFSAEISV